MKRKILAAIALAACLTANGESMKINRYKYAGPHPVATPFMVDDTDVNGKKFDAKNLLNSYVSFSQLDQAPYIDAEAVPSAHQAPAIALVGFSLQNGRYAKGEIKVDGVEEFAVFLNGKKLSGSKFEVIPATHSIVVKYLITPGQKGAPAISVESESDGAFTLREDGKRKYALTDVLHGKRFQGVSLSPDGEWLITNYATSLAGGKTIRTTTVTSLSTGNVVADRKSVV